MNPACLDQPGIFGAGNTRDADPDLAADICSGCPETGACLERFAAANRPEHVPYLMTVDGRTGDDLRRAMRMARNRAA